MRYRDALLVMAGLVWVGPAAAQDAPPQTDSGVRTKADCDAFRGAERSKCLAEIKRAERAQASPGGPNAKTAKLVNDTNTAAQAKTAAGDFAGAVALYDGALSQSGKDAPKQYLLVGKAAAQRRQAIAAYNGGAQPQYPPVGSSNDVIRAANAANAALQAQKAAAALPLLKAALATAVEAATFADAQKDKNADEAIGVELREDAELLYRLDRSGVLAAARPSIDLEVVWLKRWLAANPTLGESLVAKAGVPIAAALTAKDAALGLTLADEIKARTGNDPEGVLGYAEIVVAAKTPAGDPRRAKALAALATIEGAVVDNQKARLTQAKAALSGT